MGVALASLVALAVVVGAAYVVLGQGSDGTEEVATGAHDPAISTEDLFNRACAEQLVATRGKAIARPELTEVSGVAIVGSTTWMLNDAGDTARIFGLEADGSFRIVKVTGAEAVDWEDLAFEPGPQGGLWIADTGGNVVARDTVQLYRVPVPGPADTAVPATRVDVTFSDGPHNIEALLIEPDGSALLITKEPGTAKVYRADTALPATIASPLGSFAPTERGTSVVTGAALSADERTVAIRTYGSVRLYEIPPGSTPADALLDDETKSCAGAPSDEVQGEAVAFLPDGRGYVTIGEGLNPALTTVRRPD